MHFGYRASDWVPRNTGAFDQISVPQPDFVPGIQAMVFGRWGLAEVVLFDVQDLREGDFARPGGFVFWIVDGGHFFGSDRRDSCQ